MLADSGFSLESGRRSARSAHAATGSATRQFLEATMRQVRALSLIALVALVVACDEPPTPVEPLLSRGGFDHGGSGFDPITPFTGAAACLAGAADEPFQLPARFRQRIIARQGDFATTNPEVNFDMLTLNETGRDARRLLYRTHEVGPFAGLSVTDLKTGTSALVLEREDWESFDGLVWTPWGTILMAEEAIVADVRDPDYPDIERGLIYEFFPRTGRVVARPAVGARSHEGLRFDREGNLYGISESRGIANAGASGESGAIFKFVPHRKGDLSSGRLYALRVASGRTGPAEWVLLDLDPTTFDSDAAAQAAGATGWDRPEDIEIGWVHGRDVLYVAVTEHSPVAPNNGLVLRIELRGRRAVVSDYVAPGVNVAFESGGDAGTGFDDPDNLVLHPNGDLYIAEDDSPGDVWVARGSGAVASDVVVFARLLDCDAEPTGIYFDRSGRTLWVNSQHAGLNGGADLTIEITTRRGDDGSHDEDEQD
jgi:hypothetical protein